jgi:predicted transglutaminase-like cysteine proteinase
MRVFIAIGICVFLSACAHTGPGGQFAAMQPDADEPVAASETITTNGQPIQDINGYRVLKQEHPELFIWQKAQEINHSVNEQINYRPDAPGISEVWHVMPTGGQGNCHDYAVTKLFEMIQAGVPRQSMRLTVASVNSTGEFHVMLAVDIPGRGTFFMDSNRENIETAAEAKGLYTLWFMENPVAGRMELVG